MTEPLHIPDESFVCELAADTPPAAEVPDGALLEIDCRSAGDRFFSDDPGRADRPNPATGPIAVAGARPGQALAFDILDVRPGPRGHLCMEGREAWEPVPIAADHCVYRGVRVPLRPMIGVLGVAPAEGAWSTMNAGQFGGNMDVNDVAPGARVTIPVRRPGGPFVLGDVHAVMGDGEIGGQGLECPARVTLRVGIDPAPPSDHILIVRDGRLSAIGTGETIESAVADAVGAMVRLIVSAGIVEDDFSAGKLLGLAGETLFGQHCCRVKTVRVAADLSIFPGLGT